MLLVLVCNFNEKGGSEICFVFVEFIIDIEKIWMLGEISLVEGLCFCFNLLLDMCYCGVMIDVYIYVVVERVVFKGELCLCRRMCVVVISKVVIV